MKKKKEKKVKYIYIIITNSLGYALKKDVKVKT